MQGSLEYGHWVAPGTWHILGLVPGTGTFVGRLLLNCTSKQLLVLLFVRRGDVVRTKGGVDYCPTVVFSTVYDRRLHV